MNEGDIPVIEFIGCGLDNKKVLDLGCGDSSFADAFSGLSKEKYFGLEIVEKKLKIAKEKGYNVKRVNIEIERLPFESEEFDAVIAKDIMEHLSSFSLLLGEIWRVLKPWGAVYVSVPSEWSRLIWDDYTHKRGFTCKAIKTLFSDNGFVIEEVERYRDLIKLKTSPLKYIGCLMFKFLTGCDLITQGYVLKAKKHK